MRRMDPDGRDEGRRTSGQDFARRAGDVRRRGRAERYLNELQMLQAAAVVDELQPDLKERLGSRTHIGSLSNLMAKMKEKRQKEMNCGEGEVADDRAASCSRQ